MFRALRGRINPGRVLSIVFVLILCTLCFFNLYMVLEAASGVLGKIAASEDIHVKKEIEAFTDAYNLNFYRKFDFLNINGLASRAMGQRYMNKTVLLDNNHMARYEDLTTRLGEDALRESAAFLGEIHRTLRARGAELLYVQAPSEVDPYDPQLPVGVVDEINPSIDSFMALLAEEGVPYLNIREELHAEGLSVYDYMYPTDHHWTVSGGFYAYTKIAEHLERAGIALDPMLGDFDNYRVVRYEDWFLGSVGQRTGAWYNGIDDFEWFAPAFDTLLVNAGEGLTGGFTSILQDLTPLEKKKPPYTGAYGYVFYKSGSGHFQNLKEYANGKKLLIVSDSMGYVVNPYLILGFSEVRAMRHMDKEVLDAFAPDYVIYIMYPPNMNKLVQ